MSQGKIAVPDSQSRASGAQRTERCQERTPLLANAALFRLERLCRVHAAARWLWRDRRAGRGILGQCVRGTTPRCTRPRPFRRSGSSNTRRTCPTSTRPTVSWSANHSEARQRPRSRPRTSRASRRAVNFAGGGGGRPDTHPEQPCSADRMTELFASYGASARIPTLWLYSENDKYWGAAIPRLWHEAFVDRGGTGQFVQLPPYKADGHPIFTGNPAAWKPAFEDFLASCCQAADETAQGSASRPGISQRHARLHASAQSLGHEAQSEASGHCGASGRTHCPSGGNWRGESAAPVLLASLSKAITGACVATLVRDGKLAFDTPLSKALAKFFKANGDRPTQGSSA